MDRTTIVRGPALVTYNSQTIYSQGDITITWHTEMFDVATARFGPQTDKRAKDRWAEITFTPAGEWTKCVAALWPYTSTNAGASVCGATDKTLVIHSYWIGNTGVDDPVITFANAFVQKQPDINFAATKVMVGAVTFKAITALAGSYSASDNGFVTMAANTVAPTDTFAPGDVITQPYTGTWAVNTYTTAPTDGTTPWTAFRTQDGFQVSFDVTMEPVETDTDGLIDYTFASQIVTAKCMPVGMNLQAVLRQTPMQYWGATGTGSAFLVGRGVSMSGRGALLSINDMTSPTPVHYFYLNNAALVSAGERYGMTTLRHGEIMWQAMRHISAGTDAALFSIMPGA